MVKEHALSMRYRAVGMVNGSLTHVLVIKQLKIRPSTPERRIALDRQGETLENRKGHREEMVMIWSCNRRGEVCAEAAPANKETGGKTDCEAV